MGGLSDYVTEAPKIRVEWRPKTRADREREKRKRRTPIPKHRRGEQYLLGPVPIGWVEMANRADAGDLTVTLWHQARLEGSGTFLFNASLEAERLGMHRTTLNRKLRKLRDAGLILLDNLKGNRAAWVTLLPTPKGEE